MSSFAPKAQLVRLTIPSGALPEFYKFPELPGEVREAVWEKVEYERRIIHVALDWVENGMAYYDTLGRPQYKYTRSILKGICQVPSMLQACRESRYYALKRYSLSFQTRLCGRPVYIDWTQDTIHMVSPEVYEAFLSGDDGPPMRPEGCEEIGSFKSRCQHLILSQQPLDGMVTMPVDVPNLRRLDYGNDSELSQHTLDNVLRSTLATIDSVWRDADHAMPMVHVHTPIMLQQYTGYRFESEEL